MSFDRLAPFYRAMEFLTAGGKLQRCRTAFLGDLPAPRKILMVGEGHGRFLPEFVRSHPDAYVLVVDSSEKMLGIARSKVKSERVEFLHADLLEWTGPQGEFDLIITQFVLDCFMEEDLAVVVDKLATMAAPQADWFIADFAIPAGGPARWRSRVILSLLYRFFRIATGLRANTLISPDAEIARAGFTCYRHVTYEWGLLKSEWWRRGPSVSP